MAKTLTNQTEDSDFPGSWMRRPKMNARHQEQGVALIKLRKLCVFPAELLHVMWILNRGLIRWIPNLCQPKRSQKSSSRIELINLPKTSKCKCFRKAINQDGENQLLTMTYPSFEHVANIRPLWEKLTCNTWWLWASLMSSVSTIGVL